LNILFLCTSNLQRSPTAQELFETLDPSHVYRSAGLSEKYVKKAGTTLCSEDTLSWADRIYVFEQNHIDRIQKYTGDLFISKIFNLDIQDEYQYFQMELILILLERIKKLGHLTTIS